MRAAGEALRLGLEAAEVSQALLAYRTGLSTKHINQLVKGKVPLSIEVAVMVEEAVPAIDAAVLLVLQMQEELDATRTSRRSGRGRRRRSAPQREKPGSQTGSPSPAPSPVEPELGDQPAAH